MTIITISRGSYSRGKEIAEKVAEKLGYECIARETLLEASGQFNIEEAKLVRAVHDAPSILDRFTYGKEKYIAYIQTALARQVRGGNAVYHGLAGHFLLHGVSHVLNVRITADMEDRIAIVMDRDHVGEKEALRILKHDDEERRRWSHSLYGIDTTDPSLYDLMLFIKKISVDDAADIICRAAQSENLRTTPESQKKMDDLVLACEVKIRLIEIIPDIDVHAENGVVFIRADIPVAHRGTMTREITEIAFRVEGVQQVKVEAVRAPFASED